MAKIPQDILEARKLLAQGETEQAQQILKNYLSAGQDNLQLAATALDLLGRSQCARGNFTEGIKSLEQGVSLLIAGKNTEQEDLSRLIVSLYQNLAFARMEAGDYSGACDSYQKAMNHASRTSDPDLMANANFAISALYYRQKQYEEAEARVSQARELWLELGNQEKVATCLNNLGRIYEEKGELASGVAFHREAVELRRQLPNREDLAFSLGNLGVALASMGNFQEASERLKEAVEIYVQLDKAQSPECLAYIKNLEICERLARME